MKWIGWMNTIRWADLVNVLPDLVKEIRSKPDTIIQSLGLAMHQVRKNISIIVADLMAHTCKWPKSLNAHFTKENRNFFVIACTGSFLTLDSASSLWPHATRCTLCLQLIIMELSHDGDEDNNCIQRSENQSTTRPSSSSLSASSELLTSPENAPYQPQYIHCRLLNFEPVTSLKNLKANYFGLL